MHQPDELTLGLFDASRNRSRSEQRVPSGMNDQTQINNSHCYYRSIQATLAARIVFQTSVLLGTKQELFNSDDLQPISNA